MKLKFIENEVKPEVGQIWRMKDDDVRLIIRKENEYVAIDLITMGAMNWKENINELVCVTQGTLIGHLELEP